MQQVKLHRGQAKLFTIPANELVGVEIEQPTPEPEGIGRCLGLRAAGICIGTAAQYGADAREQLTQIERLSDVIVGAHFEANHAVDDFASGGQHHDADIAVFAQTASEGQPVFTGHVDIEDYEIGGFFLQPRRHRLAIHCGAHAKTVPRQVFRDRLA